MLAVVQNKEVWHWVDKMQRTALHVLSANPCVTGELLRLLAGALLQGQKNAWQARDKGERTPLHVLCLNAHASAATLSAACSFACRCESVRTANDDDLRQHALHRHERWIATMRRELHRVVADKRIAEETLHAITSALSASDAEGLVSTMFTRRAAVDLTASISISTSAKTHSSSSPTSSILAKTNTCFDEECAMADFGHHASISDQHAVRADPFLANATLSNARELNGHVAIIQRSQPGEVSFGLQAKHAQDAGAIAVILTNNTDEEFVAYGEDDASAIKIPVVCVKKSTADRMTADTRVSIHTGEERSLMDVLLLRHDLGTIVTMQWLVDPALRRTGV